MFCLLDWYEDPNTPDVIGQYETKEEAKKAWSKYYDDTDGECKLEIIAKGE